MKSLLVDGMIPAGQPCPFHNICQFRLDRCPSDQQVKDVDFSCAAARLHDAIERRSHRVT